ncbi:MAG TPA: VOC family protein [Gemmatimonadaceae bacterium]|nr:VOC family protein [Gemmatimonadaceae bacterium]
MATATEFSLARIGQIHIPVTDLERAVRFYRDTLGMRFLFQVPNMAFFDAAGVRLMLGVPEKDEFRHPASVLYYKVDDIQRAHQTLTERGVVFADEPHLIAKLEDHDLWMCFFRDSEHNMVALMSEVRR